MNLDTEQLQIKFECSLDEYNIQINYKERKYGKCWEIKSNCSYFEKITITSIGVLVNLMGEGGRGWGLIKNSVSTFFSAILLIYYNVCSFFKVSFL